MTPKEKAIELRNKFHNEITFNRNIESIECAFICIEELIKYTPSIDIFPPNFGKPNESCREFWQEVKTEIEKL